MVNFRPIRALFLGPPGAGKGTLTSRLVRDVPNLTTVSSGDVLRTNIAAKTAVGLQAQKYIARGDLVPDGTMIELLNHIMLERKYLSPSASWILDGFPRTPKQAELLDVTLEQHSAAMNCVVWLNVPKDVIVDRIENRWVHGPSGRVYNLTYNPPKKPGLDDVTGEPLTKRDDDTVELFLKRFDNYTNETAPLIDYYQRRGILTEFRGVSSDDIYPKMFDFVLKHYGTNEAQPQPAAKA